MPRGPRVVVPGIALHIVQRGHDRRNCFRHETDYLVYLSNVRELAARTGCALHAYCLMTNHVHLLLTPSSLHSCALLMRNLGQRYVQYFNRRYNHSGTLWEGRFHSCLVDSASYILACYRYIERNPVRAGMVQALADYRWSSHQANAGLASDDSLTAHPEYDALGLDRDVRHVAYRGLFAAGDDSSFLTAIRHATYGGYALIGERLKASLPPSLQRRLERQRPGPKPPPDNASTFAQAALELGLRPRTI